jgi:hypothetical protein
MRKYHLKRDFVVAPIIIVAGIYFLQTGGSPPITWLMIVAGGLLAAFILYMAFLLPHVIYRSQPKLKSEYHLEFSDHGIRFRTDEIDSQLTWTNYQSWQQNNEFYLLQYGGFVTIVPRRALSQDADERLAEMFFRHLGDAKA